MTASEPRSGARSNRRESWRSAAGLFAVVALAYLAGAVLSWQILRRRRRPGVLSACRVTVAAMLLTPRSRWAVIVSR